MTTAESAILYAGAGASVLAFAGALVRRLGIEFERAWERALAAPPEPFEVELGEQLLAEMRLRRETVRREGAVPVREAVPA